MNPGIWIFVAALFMFSACRDENIGALNETAPEDVIPIGLKGQHIHDIAKLKNIVRLENHPDALLGWVDRVVVGAGDDFFILDRRSTKKLYRFRSDGSFMRTIGSRGEGPGEYQQIEDFWITQNRTCYVLENNKVHKFDLNSDYLGTRTLSFVSRQGDALGNHFVVSRLWSRDEGNAMFVLFNEDMEIAAEFGRRDPILAKFPLVPQRHIATAGDHIFTAEFVQSEIKRFGPSGRLLNRFTFPNATADALERLKTPKPSPEDEKFVLGRIHSIYQIWACNRFLYINENLADLGTRRSSLFVPGRKAFYVLDNDTVSADGDSVELNHIQGIVGEALIQVVFEEKTLRRLETDYPELAGVHMEPNDNPILLLLDLSGWPGE